MSLTVHGIEVSEDNTVYVDFSLCSSPIPDTQNTEFLIHRIEFYTQRTGKNPTLLKWQNPAFKN